MKNKIASELLAKSWRDAGVVEGDTLLLHSSGKRTLHKLKELGYEPDPDIIVDSFLLALGENGTLLLPLFNFDFTTGVPFDINTTPSHMGLVTETGRKREGAVRTGHPIYSFAVLGAQKERFRHVNNVSGYGKDSPFGILHEMDGKIAVLDLPDQNSMTFYHYIEESLGVDYRYQKQFSGSYTAADGSCSERTYSLFVRNIEQGVVTHVNPMGEILWEKGCYTGDRPGEGSGLRTIRAQVVFDEAAQVIKSGNAKGVLYEIK